jgi:putative acetyltransferase
MMQRAPSAPGDDAGAIRVRRDDLTHPAVLDLLREHLRDVAGLSPPESVHAMGIERLRQPDVTFWTAWNGPDLLGCGALRELDRSHGEVKSMRTSKALRRRGAAKALLMHILAEARARGYRKLSLETGSAAAFAPAHALYRSFGFVACGPFGEYTDDPHSVFMSLAMDEPGR